MRKDTGVSIILVDFNQPIETTQKWVEYRADSGRAFHLVSFADNFSVEEGESKMKDFLAGIDAGVAGTHIYEGKLEDSIEDIVEELNASAIIFTLNPNGKRRFFSGPRSLKLISSLEVVFVVLQHGAKIGEVKKIALPLELTKESKQKFLPAAAVAEDLEAELDIYVPIFKDDHSNSAVSRNMLWVDRYLKDSGVKHTFNKATHHKDFEEQFINFIDNNESDMVIILNYGDSFLSSLFGSSEMEILENGAKAPVMIMNYKSTYRSKVPVLGQ